jgi:hypothetical protein
VKADDLRLTFASFEVRYPPLRKFEGSALTDFFAEIHEAHPFEDFAQHGTDGADMWIESERYLTIERDKLKHQEQVATAIEMIARNGTDLVKELNAFFDAYAIRGPDVTLRALWPVENYDDFDRFSEYIRESVLTIDADQYDVLGSTVPVGPSLQFVGIADEPYHCHWGFEVDPYWPDEKQIFIDLNADYIPAPTVEDPEEIGDRISAAYAILTDKVVPFLQSFLP